MAKRTLESEVGVNIENELVSSYVRLCLSEGIKPDEAFKQLKLRLQAVKDLKLKSNP